LVVARPEVVLGEEIPRPLAGAPRAEWAARWHEWRGDRRIAAALLACVALASAVAWFRAGATSSASSALPAPASAVRTNDAPPISTTSTRPAAAIVVYVVGAVRRAGVVRLPAGARVIDAIDAAGGAAPAADLARLNLATALADGSRVAVPSVGAPAPGVDPSAVSGAPSVGSDSGPSASAPVNLNTATAAQLDALPGIGPATAATIIKDREAHGPFRSVNDLGRVRGIGDSKLGQLRELVTV
jgi:competence protein ComEA